MNPLFHLLFQSTRIVSMGINKALKPFDLYASQWTVLYAIHNYGEMTMKEMSTVLHVEAPTITRTVRRLEELGWVCTFTGSDKRERIVSLSAKAQEQYPELQRVVDEFESGLLNDLTLLEQEHLVDLVMRLKEAGEQRW